MKIISKFKDYYDFVVLETDNRKVYVRDNTIISSYKFKEMCNNRYAFKDAYSANFYLGIVWFCDHRYPYLHQLNTKNYWYNFSEIPTDVLDMLKNENTTLSYRPTMLSVVEMEFDVRYNHTKREYEKREYNVHEKNAKLNTQINTPVIYTRYRGMGEIVLNGSLSEIKFGSVKSPSETYTEIYNFIPFIEPTTDSDPINMNRFESKGFDKKTSFRNTK